jgi:putative hydrolase of the HAD superfamily
VMIREHKTTDALRSILRDLKIDDPKTVWMIGNSMRSDINPALEAGANAIFVDVENPWEFDVVEPISSAYHSVRTFGEAVDFLLRRT